MRASPWIAGGRGGGRRSRRLGCSRWRLFRHRPLGSASECRPSHAKTSSGSPGPRLQRRVRSAITQMSAVSHRTLLRTAGNDGVHTPRIPLAGSASGTPRAAALGQARDRAAAGRSARGSDRSGRHAARPRQPRRAASCDRPGVALGATSNSVQFVFSVRAPGGERRLEPRCLPPGAGILFLFS
jgi:hypothetical protein